MTVAPRLRIVPDPPAAEPGPRGQPALRERREFGRQVRERTARIEARAEERRREEVEHRAARERERLLEEIHDGLGSQLLLARMNALRGNLTPAETVQAFDDCIAELRLAIDGLSVADGDLPLLLATLRHRCGARLAGAGLALDWQVADTPPVPALKGTGGSDLVRIVQEAINNAIHHAGATRLRIATATATDGDTVTVTVADDGRGLEAGASEGRGLRNMRARALRLGASIAWLPAPGGGTEMRLDLPLG